MKTILLIPLILVLFSGCTAYQTAMDAPPITPDNTSTTLIVISDYHFNPQTVTVHEGETITWKNLDSDVHSLKYGDIESDPLKRGETFSIIAQVPGRYNYSSGNHPFIEGTIIITSP